MTNPCQSIFSGPFHHALGVGYHGHIDRLRVFALLMSLLSLLWFSSLACAENAPLIKLISEKNLKDIQRSLGDGSYRGEEGVLRIRPEVGKSLGMKVFGDQDYAESRDLFTKAESALEKAKMAMASREQESSPGEYAQIIAENALLYKASQESARKKLMLYRSRLNASVDERLSETISAAVMDRLLTENLKRADYQLRDALGYFFNVCRGAGQDGFPLTTENVTFVNDLFQQWVTESTPESRLSFGLDKQEDYRGKGIGASWQNALGSWEFPYIQVLEDTLKKLHPQLQDTDPLLFIALMKRESGFDPLAVSSAGAAGLTQISPDTALGLGMKSVFTAPYLSEAASLSNLERKTRAQALSTLFQINEENRLDFAARARDLMQKSLAYGQSREKLYAQYRKDLLHDGTDDRLKPPLAIEFGLRHFLQLMKEQKGDISLALAAYNAGAQRVREYKGIPPFSETVQFRNKVLESYRDYLQKLRIPYKTL